ncbi:nuclear transport factor 2 family protein [Dactylosporangium matsuzakiense]|nr:nuclear transport factor 2 family protein [Dactylosporangium matsuzakiense]UWZ41543.1 nuclear transport factor 2 family protein [Dactylosporangium matsuzakiense]
MDDDGPRPEDAELLRRTYRAFNARDIDEILATMSPQIDWPNMMDNVRAHGRDEVREYWLRQFAEIDPRVEPTGMRVEPDGRICVDVHQVVRNLAGDVLADQHVQHVYTIRDGLLERMDVR